MRTLLLSLLIFPSIAVAYTCNYTSECYENEACQETAYDMTVLPSEDYTTAAVSSITGDFEATAYNFQGMSSFVGLTKSTLHLISISGRGESRYSVQTGDGNGVTVITYLGRCE